MSLTNTDKAKLAANPTASDSAQSTSRALATPNSDSLIVKTKSNFPGWRKMWPPLGYLILTLSLTWPLALNLSDGIIHFIASDHYQNLWNIWWFRTALFERHSNPFYTDALFYPYRTGSHSLELYFHTLQPFLMLLLAPLSYLIGIVGSYNLIVVASFVVSGWGMYLLAKYFTQNALASFVAGVLFDFCAYHFNILAVGQTNLMLTGTIPLYILFLHRSIAPLQPGNQLKRVWLYPALAILTLTIAAYIDWYYPLYLLLYTAGLLLVRLATRFKDWRTTLLRSVVILACWAGLIAPFLALMLHSTATDTDISYKPTFDFEVIHSAALFSFFQPIKDLRIEPGAWQQPFLGYTTLVLAAIGLWFCRQKRGWWLWWLAVIALFGLLALGPYLRLNLTDDATQAIATGLPLPYLWLQNIPPISFSRSPSRFVIMVELALAMLAAYGVTGLIELAETVGKKVKIKRTVLASGLAALIIGVFSLEMQTLPWPVQTMDQPQIFKQIANEPGDFAIMEVPLTAHGVEDARRTYYQTIHHRPIAGGYIARKLTDYFRGDASPFDDYFDRVNHQTYPILAPDNNQNAPIRLLNLDNFRYLVIYKDEYWADNDSTFYNGNDPEVNKVWQQNYQYFQKLLGAESQVYQDSNITVFRVPQLPATSTPLLYSMVNWYGIEHPANQPAYQWAKADPTLLGANTVTQKVHLKMTAFAFQEGSIFDVQLNGQKVAQLTLDRKAADYVTPEFVLPQGEFQLVLHNLTPPISPQSLDPKSNDNRALTLGASYIELVPDK